MLWRYFKPSRFTEFLSTGKIYFAAAREFTDKFEGATAVLAPDFPEDPRFKGLSQTDQAFEQLRRLTKISCWHIERDESAAMWQLYADAGKGVAVRTSVARLLEAIRPFFAEGAKEPEDLYYGSVRYVNLLKVRISIHSMHRFFHKHRAFSSEKEFRLAISLAMAEEFGVRVPARGILVDICPDHLIDRIYIGPYVSAKRQAELVEEIRRSGFHERVAKSCLLGTPRYT